MNKIFCHICGSDLLYRLGALPAKLVSSDCKPVDRPADYVVCGNCATVQKILIGEYNSYCDKIYKNYSVYYQGDGEEQKIFTDSGPVPRSAHIIKKIFKDHEISLSGSLLDIGCGNGNFLRSFNRVYPGWDLTGLEYDTKDRETISAIPGVKKFLSLPLYSINEKFDIIVMLHLLEHIRNPVYFLQQVIKLLSSDGYLLIEVPDLGHNPFDLLIYDHCSHFTEISLVNLLNITGFRIIDIRNDIIPKELTVLAEKHVGQCRSYDLVTYDHESVDAALYINWLEKIKKQVSLLSTMNDSLCVFGTTIAATWISSIVDVDFFVDEDMSRVGHRLHGKPVLKISQLHGNEIIYLPFPFEMAFDLRKRLYEDGVKNTMAIPSSMYQQQGNAEAKDN